MAEIPFVSVCIQTYQQKNFITSCLESVLMQKTSFPFEIIVGEDDSTDGTREICKAFAEKFPDKIRLFLRSEKDRIYIDGQKTGRFNFLSNLHAARGKYIALLDGDDRWIDEYKLQKQVSWMETQPGMVISTHNVYWKKEKGYAFIPAHLNMADENRVFTLDDLLEKYFLHMSAIVFLRQSVLDLPLWYKELPVIDIPLSLHIAQNGTIGFMKEAMAVYNIHKYGMWNSLQSPHDYIKLWKLYTMLAIHFEGKIKTAMEKKRIHAGKWLINFYQKRLWYDSAWLKKELGEFNFEGDKGLLKELNDIHQWKNYWANLGNIAKAGIKAIYKR